MKQVHVIVPEQFTRENKAGYEDDYENDHLFRSYFVSGSASSGETESEQLIGVNGRTIKNYWKHHKTLKTIPHS